MTDDLTARVTATYPDDADLAAMWLGRDVFALACDGDLNRQYDLPYRRALRVWVSPSGIQHLTLRLTEVAA